MNSSLALSEAAISSLSSKLSLIDKLLLLLLWSKGLAWIDVVDVDDVDVDEWLPEVQQMRLTQKHATQSQVAPAPHGTIARALIELPGLLVVPLHMQRHHVAVPSEACDTLTIAAQCGGQAYITLYYRGLILS